MTILRRLWRPKSQATWVSLKVAEALGLIRKRKLGVRFSILLLFAVAYVSRMTREYTVDAYNKLEKLVITDGQNQTKQ